ncbi:transcriptional regulator [Bacillus freudenreichii]|nr:transcriptional regulator [Bacillus freudenreichii]
MEPYVYIKDAIITGQFEPGKRLTEEALAKQLKVSRTPIRQAIQQLESNGLVTPLKSRGVIVREFSIEDIRQIYNLRAILESYAASEAALHCTSENYQQLLETNNIYEDAIARHKKMDIQSIKKIHQSNHDFHEAIFKATKNEHIRSLISKVVMVPLVFRSYYWYDEKQLLHSLEAHKTLLEAIKNKEPERAKVAMQEHILHGRDNVLKHESNINIKFWKGDAK